MLENDYAKEWHSCVIECAADLLVTACLISNCPHEIFLEKPRSAGTSCQCIDYVHSDWPNLHQFSNFQWNPKPNFIKILSATFRWNMQTDGFNLCTHLTHNNIHPVHHITFKHQKCHLWVTQCVHLSSSLRSEEMSMSVSCCIFSLISRRCSRGTFLNSDQFTLTACFLTGCKMLKQREQLHSTPQERAWYNFTKQRLDVTILPCSH
jgi:hypothetical protein